MAFCQASQFDDHIAKQPNGNQEAPTYGKIISKMKETCKRSLKGLETPVTVLVVTRQQLQQHAVIFPQKASPMPLVKCSGRKQHHK